MAGILVKGTDSCTTTRLYLTSCVQNLPESTRIGIDPTLISACEYMLSNNDHH
jgi:hypothetical protein